MDTQIGTRPQIGALEIHQAYILASLNWLQQTRSLEMNHVAIEKAEKAKLLGFDHSSVITDAEKYMNNLETFKCYNWLEREFYKSNHTKYHRYFKEWITNICPHQVEGFRNQMIGQLTKSKVK